MLARTPIVAGVPAGDVDAVVAALAGFFLWGCLLPDPPGLPTVRGYQRDRGEVALRWLRRRLAAPG